MRTIWHERIMADKLFTLTWDPQPTVFENHVVSMDVDGVPLELALWDTAGKFQVQLACPTFWSRRTHPSLLGQAGSATL